MGVFAPPLLQQRSDTPCPMLTWSSWFNQEQRVAVPGIGNRSHRPRRGEERVKFVPGDTRLPPARVHAAR